MKVVLGLLLLASAGRSGPARKRPQLFIQNGNEAYYVAGLSQVPIIIPAQPVVIKTSKEHTEYGIPDVSGPEFAPSEGGLPSGEVARPDTDAPVRQQPGENPPEKPSQGSQESLSPGSSLPGILALSPPGTSVPDQSPGGGSQTLEGPSPHKEESIQSHSIPGPEGEGFPDNSGEQLPNFTIVVSNTPHDRPDFVNLPDYQQLPPFPENNFLSSIFSSQPPQNQSPGSPARPPSHRPVVVTHLHHTHHYQGPQTHSEFVLTGLHFPKEESQSPYNFGDILNFPVPLRRKPSSQGVSPNPIEDSRPQEQPPQLAVPASHGPEVVHVPGSGVPSSDGHPGEAPSIPNLPSSPTDKTAPATSSGENIPVQQFSPSAPASSQDSDSNKSDEFVPDTSGQYTPGTSGQYHPGGSDQGVPDLPVQGSFGQKIPSEDVSFLSPAPKPQPAQSSEAPLIISPENSGQYVPDNSGTYNPDSSGQYVPVPDQGSGEGVEASSNFPGPCVEGAQFSPPTAGYSPDTSGQYIPDNSGQYIPGPEEYHGGELSPAPAPPALPEDSGQYIPDTSGEYVHDSSGQYVPENNQVEQKQPIPTSVQPSPQTPAFIPPSFSSPGQDLPTLNQEVSAPIPPNIPGVSLATPTFQSEQSIPNGPTHHEQSEHYTPGYDQSVSGSSPIGEVPLLSPPKNLGSSPDQDQPGQYISDTAGQYVTGISDQPDQIGSTQAQISSFIPEHFEGPLIYSPQYVPINVSPDESFAPAQIVPQVDSNFPQVSAGQAPVFSPTVVNILPNPPLPPSDHESPAESSISPGYKPDSAVPTVPQGEGEPDQDTCGQYIPDTSGQYVPDLSCQYFPDEESHPGTAEQKPIIHGQPSEGFNVDVPQSTVQKIPLVELQGIQTAEVLSTGPAQASPSHQAEAAPPSSGPQILSIRPSKPHGHRPPSHHQDEEEDLFPQIPEIVTYAPIYVAPYPPDNTHLLIPFLIPPPPVPRKLGSRKL